MSFTPIPFESLQYLNPTQSPPPTINNDQCVVKTVPGTDWWHTTERDSQDGLAWGKWIEVGNGFEVKVKASVEVTERVSCLFLYFGPHSWIKAGVEYDMGKLWDGAVCCNPYSDWAITPAKEGVEYTIAYNPSTLHIRIFLDDVMIREVHGFPLSADGSGSSSSSTAEKGEKGKGKVFVGVMGCSPLGKGTEATFEGLAVKNGVRDVA